MRYMKDIEMPDGEIFKQKETITFCVKQFFLSDKPKLKESDTLLLREDISYLVSFKRLQGTFEVYNKVLKGLLHNGTMAEIIDYDFMIDIAFNSGTTIYRAI